MLILRHSRVLGFGKTGMKLLFRHIFLATNIDFGTSDGAVRRLQRTLAELRADLNDADVDSVPLPPNLERIVQAICSANRQHYLDF